MSFKKTTQKKERKKENYSRIYVSTIFRPQWSIFIYLLSDKSIFFVYAHK